MNRTRIEWVKNVDGTPGYTVNPMTGCLNCINGKCGGVFPCYAYLQSRGRCHQQDLKGEPTYDGSFYPRGLDYSFYPRIHHERFQQLFNAPRGAGIFVCDRSDWAASYWPEWCQIMILEAARKKPNIRLYLLTKQPQELAKWSPFPDNVWVGVTVTTNGMASLAYTSGLSQIKATVRFISFEPLLGQIGRDELRNLASVSDWWIIGAQTKPYKPPEITCVKEIVDAANNASIPVFLKNNLKPLLSETHTFGPQFARETTNFKITELRQEMPAQASIIMGVTPIERS